MKLKSIIIIIFIFNALIIGQKKHVSFTFDDLPFVALRNKNIDFQKTASLKLLQSIKKHKIPAIGFVNEFKLYNGDKLDQQKVDLLKLWLNAALDLGNHTFSHMDYHRVNCNEYFNDIIKGEKVTKQLMKNFNKKIKYFRHPYLHIGETKDKADSLRTFLKENGYVEAPVTIDNSDWIFNSAYDSAMAKQDTALMKRIGIEYINYMESKLKYYESETNKIFGRNINQILLLHASELNADYLDDLAKMYERNNYDFIPLSQTLKDEAYSTEITAYKNWGISWLDRWALSKGKRGSFFKDEPVTPEYIMKLAKVEHE